MANCKGATERVASDNPVDRLGLIEFLREPTVSAMLIRMAQAYCLFVSRFKVIRLWAEGARGSSQ